MRVLTWLQVPAGVSSQGWRVTMELPAPHSPPGQKNSQEERGLPGAVSMEAEEP